MVIRDSDRRLRKLKLLISRTQNAANLGAVGGPGMSQRPVGPDLQLQAEWARYICVLAAGFMERSLSAIYVEYIRTNSAGPISKHGQFYAERVPNAKAEQFVEIAKRFDPAWGQALDDFLAEDGRKDAIDSIVNNRNLIAHGGDSGITVARVADYLDKCVRVLEFIENQCGLSITAP